jgi:hypothetical protein
MQGNFNNVYTAEVGRGGRVQKIPAAGFAVRFISFLFVQEV